MSENANQIHEIVPGLFLGNAKSTNDKQQLKYNFIRSILAIMEKEPAKISDTVQNFINITRHPDDILLIIDKCLEIISHFIVKKPNVLVICSMGNVHSSIAILGYVMKSQKLNVVDGIKCVKSKLKNLTYGSDFLIQLKLWEIANYKVDMNERVIKTYFLVRWQKNYLNFKDNFPKWLDYWEVFFSHYKEKITYPKYMCKNCNNFLLDSEDVICKHDTSPHLYIFPIVWICYKTFANFQGTLDCPKCKTKLGYFNWLGFNKKEKNTRTNARNRWSKAPLVFILEIEKLNQIEKDMIENTSTATAIEEESSSLISEERKINEIMPGVFIGSVQSANDAKQLSQNSIKSILSIMRTKPQFQKLENVRLHLVEITGTPEDDLFLILDKIFEIISDSLEKKRNILVHCQTGVLHSAAVLIAYVMKKKNFTLWEAYKDVKNKHSITDPGPNFLDQLKLWESVKYNIDFQELVIRNYFLERWQKYILNYKEEISKWSEYWEFYFDYKKEKSPSVDYMCKNCNNLLFDNEDVIESNSSKLIYTFPVIWICCDTFGKLRGDLDCPKCKINLGYFNWSGLFSKEKTVLSKNSHRWSKTPLIFSFEIDKIDHVNLPCKKDMFEDTSTEDNQENFILEYSQNQIKMNEIIPRLFLGSVQSANDPQQLNENSIKVILSIMITKPKLQYLENIKHIYINTAGTPDDDLLMIINKVIQIISDALEQNLNILVNCETGILHSAALVIAYVMKSLNLTTMEAYKYVKDRRSIVDPKEDFIEQLQLWQHVKYEVNLSHCLIKTYLFARWQALFLSFEQNYVKWVEYWQIFFDYTDNNITCPSYLCKICFCLLFNIEDIIEEDSKYIYVFPIVWICFQWAFGTCHGVLRCPQCKTKLGYYNWHTFNSQRCIFSNNSYPWFKTPLVFFIEKNQVNIIDIEGVQHILHKLSQTESTSIFQKETSSQQEIETYKGVQKITKNMFGKIQTFLRNKLTEEEQNKKTQLLNRLSFDSELRPMTKDSTSRETTDFLQVIESPKHLVVENIVGSNSKTSLSSNESILNSKSTKQRRPRKRLSFKNTKAGSDSETSQSSESIAKCPPKKGRGSQKHSPVKNVKAGSKSKTSENPIKSIPKSPSKKQRRPRKRSSFKNEKSGSDSETLQPSSESMIKSPAKIQKHSSPIKNVQIGLDSQTLLTLRESVIKSPVNKEKKPQMYPPVENMQVGSDSQTSSTLRKSVIKSPVKKETFNK